MDTLLSDQPEAYRLLIKRSLRLYRRGLPNSLALAFFCSLVIYLPAFLLHFFGASLWFNPFALRGIIYFSLFNLLALFFFIMLIWHLYCTMKARHEPMLEDFQKGTTKFIAVVIASLIASVILFVVNFSWFVFLLVMNGYSQTIRQHYWINTNLIIFSMALMIETFLIFYIMTLFSFIIPLITIENKGIIAAIKQSVLYTWNHWWRAFSVQMTPWLYYFFTLNILHYLLKNILLLSVPASSFWSIFFVFIVFLFFIPWIAAVQLVQLKDFELRISTRKHASHV